MAANRGRRPVGALEPPSRIVVAGDWHGNTGWASHVIRTAAKSLAAEERRIILNLGDYGIWPEREGEEYRAAVAVALIQAGAELWFADGNHEWFPYLALDREPEPDGRVLVSGRQYHLPRGHRWQWHGRTWLALGGGVSLDRAIRTEGRDWWPQEEITDAQEAWVTGEGHADVMVTHDCPSGVTHTFAPPPSFWDLRDLARNDAHRERLQRVVDAVQPSHLMHGHLHRAYQRRCDFGYGPVEVTGLDRDDGDGANWAVLDVKSMTWEVA